MSTIQGTRQKLKFEVVFPVSAAWANIPVPLQKPSNSVL